MARGFLSGMIWGGVLGLGVTGAASVLAPPPMAPEVSDAAPGVAQAPERVSQASSGETASTRDRTLITGQVAPQASAPDRDDTVAVSTDAQATAGQPQTGQAAGLDAPATQTEAVDVAAATREDPVLPNPQGLAPMAPQPADDLSISTEPAQPPSPATDVVQGAFDDSALRAAETPAQSDTAVVTETAAPEAPALPDTESDTVQDEVPDETTARAQAPVAEQEEIAALTQELQVKPLDPPLTVVTRGAADAETVIQTQTTPAEDAPAEEVPAKETPTEEAPLEVTPQTESAATQDVAPEQEPAAQPAETAAAEEADSTVDDSTADDRDAVVRRAIGTPSITLTERNTGVTVNRLGNEQEQPEIAVTVVDEVPAGSDQPPVKRFAQSYVPPEGKPLMGIVLIDDGSSPVAGAAGIAALRSFPYPLSFAVDTSLRDAAERMAIYRAEGLEVMAMIDLPEGAVPTDAETTLGAILPVMSDVVGVLEGTRGGLQGSREVSDQVTAILAQTGHGLLTQDKGLNTMPKLARKEGVPAISVFRDFDSKGQTAQVIRRFLDQAAFKAGQEGAVVMLGRLRPDTVSALLLWGLQDRASSVALAPISAVLLREE